MPCVARWEGGVQLRSSVDIFQGQTGEPSGTPGGKMLVLVIVSDP